MLFQVFKPKVGLWVSSVVIGLVLGLMIGVPTGWRIIVIGFVVGSSVIPPVTLILLKVTSMCLQNMLAKTKKLVVKNTIPSTKEIFIFNISFVIAVIVIGMPHGALVTLAFELNDITFNELLLNKIELGIGAVAAWILMILCALPMVHVNQKHSKIIEAVPI